MLKGGCREGGAPLLTETVHNAEFLGSRDSSRDRRNCQEATRHTCLSREGSIWKNNLKLWNLPKNSDRCGKHKSGSKRNMPQKKIWYKMPKRCCWKLGEDKIKSDSLGKLILYFTRRELEKLFQPESCSGKVSWPDKESAGVSMFSDRVDIVTGSCAAKNLTSRHFSGCSLCFAGELNERPYPSPNLHFTQLSESKLFCMICMMYDQVGLDRVNVYFCPYISWDELKELIFALYSLSSNWCFRKVK